MAREYMFVTRNVSKDMAVGDKHVLVKQTVSAGKYTNSLQCENVVCGVGSYSSRHILSQVGMSSLYLILIC